MLKYIDAHSHILTDTQIRDAVACGVEKFIINATFPGDWATVVDLAQRDNVYGAIGVHPWFVSKLQCDWELQLVNTLVAYPNLMVGEIGLDKNRPDLEFQENVFRRQLQIAYDMKRIAHIHCVGCWGKMLEILRASKLPPAVVFHAYSGSPELVDEFTKMNGFFSFGIDINNEKRTQLRLSVAAIPESRILVESDDASPEFIPAIVSKIADIRGVKNDDMAEQIYNNTMGLIHDGTF